MFMKSFASHFETTILQSGLICTLLDSVAISSPIPPQANSSENTTILQCDRFSFLLM